MSDAVKLSFEGPIAIISYDRPEKHNAATDAMDRRLFEILAELHERPGLRAVIWRGEGKSFSSGRDTTQLGVREDISDFEFIERGHRGTRLLFTLPAPTIVALKGWVIGGSLERALLCDLRIAGESAKLRLPEIAHGVVPDSGGTARLFQMAGHGLAADLALTGRVMTAEEALRHGVVSRVVPDAQLDETALEMARAIAQAPELGECSCARCAGSRTAGRLAARSVAQSLVLSATPHVKAAPRPQAALPGTVGAGARKPRRAETRRGPLGGRGLLRRKGWRACAGPGLRAARQQRAASVTASDAREQESHTLPVRGVAGVELEQAALLDLGAPALERGEEQRAADRPGRGPREHVAPHRDHLAEVERVAHPAVEARGGEIAHLAEDVNSGGLACRDGERLARRHDGRPSPRQHDHRLLERFAARTNSASNPHHIGAGLRGGRALAAAGSGSAGSRARAPAAAASRRSRTTRTGT
jgi:enoyl-CoA hydratase/carnithine racemase